MLLACAGAVRADESEPAVTPYRPTVSNPADLPVPGWLEAETGGLDVRSPDGARTDTLPWLLKYAFDANSGLLLGGDAFARQTMPHGGAQSGLGDTFLEWKQRFPLPQDLAFGIETGPQLPTAAHALGIGKPAWLFNGIVSANVGSVHVDLNAGGVRYTARVPGASAWRNAWAGAASWPLGADWGAAVELSGDARRGVDHGHQALIALNYNASPHLVFDAGVARGLDRGGHDASLFAGATFLLADFHHR